MSESPEAGVGTDRVKLAFDAFRAPPRRALPPRGTQSEDLTLQMTSADGLSELAEGTNTPPVALQAAGLPDGWNNSAVHLWVVRPDDVVYAPERCPFGCRRAKGVVKHTNLTGGGLAYAAGEILFTGPSQVVVTGFSGRYPTRPAEAMAAVEIAFLRSGYEVWTTGWDADAGTAVPLNKRPPYKVTET